MTSDNLVADLKTYIEPGRAKSNAWFFKTGPGQYGEGDLFLGVRVPDTRKVAKRYYDIDLKQVQSLLENKYHEVRLTALHILVEKYRKGDSDQKKGIYDFYCRNLAYVNNWDLVDSSAHKIVGPYLYDKNREFLYKLASSNNLWEQRVSIVSTFYFIKFKDFDDSLRLAKIFLTNKQDLIHKAVGWMLREIGKIDEKTLRIFLNENYQKMPRTMLRYAIERLPENERQAYLLGRI